MRPSYLKLSRNEFERRIEKLYQILENCELCPRKCHVNRLKNEKGYCGAGKELMVSSYFPHFGEEDVLVGRNGSGTIFLTWCNLRCVYCQNYEISNLGEGAAITEEQCADMMISLQRNGCHNINFVTPTHYTPHLVKAIAIAAEKKLRIPIVWNCSGYENVEVIKLLKGIVDIYMPDFKYGNSEYAKRYSNAPDYFERCKESIIEMHRQVGDLKIRNGIAYKGLLVRHLVLPNNIANSEKVLEFIAKISKNTYVNIMSQYRPSGEACRYPEINRRISEDEFKYVVDVAKKFGLSINKKSIT